MKLVDGGELRALVSMEAAIEAVERAFRERDDETPPRQHVRFGDGELLFMPSWSPRAAGVKLVTVNPANQDAGLPLIAGTYVLFDRASLQPVAAIDAAVLTEIRTAAVSAVATKALASPDASRLVIFGAGAQARGHLEAMTSVRPIAVVTVCAPSRSSADAIVELASGHGIEAKVGVPADVRDADIVCTCTTSTTPVFAGADLGPAAHVNAVGSYRKEARELDSEVVRRAAVVAVEDRAAMAEPGDLAQPLEQGELDPARVVALEEVLDRSKPGPEVTVFKSVGRAFEDLAVAEIVLDSVTGA